MTETTNKTYTEIEKRLARFLGIEPNQLEISLPKFIHEPEVPPPDDFVINDFTQIRYDQEGRYRVHRLDLAYTDGHREDVYLYTEHFLHDTTYMYSFLKKDCIEYISTRLKVRLNKHDSNVQFFFDDDKEPVFVIDILTFMHMEYNIRNLYGYDDEQSALIRFYRDIRENINKDWASKRLMSFEGIPSSFSTNIDRVGKAVNLFAHGRNPQNEPVEMLLVYPIMDAPSRYRFADIALPSTNR